jgi:bifunctional non-homologous end joining protein LigD
MSVRRTVAAKRPTSPALPPSVRLTHPDRVVYADQGLTKGDLAAYYALVAERMLPHVADRPLSIVRCPAGQSGDCFFQKHPPVGMSDAVKRIQIREKSGLDTYLTIDDVDGLITLIQFGALEIHTWGSRVEHLERPDRLVFDLDPAPDVAWKRVVEGALLVRGLLQQLKLKSFVKTTGGKGLHVVVPIEPEAEWDDAKRFCRNLAETIAAARPDEFLANMSKAKRQGKIFVDYLRNERGATAVAPYSARARIGAPVALPVSWKELTSLKAGNLFQVRNMAERLKSVRRDPWAEIGRVSQRLSKKLLRAE